MAVLPAELLGIGYVTGVATGGPVAAADAALVDLEVRVELQVAPHRLLKQLKNQN